MYIKVKVSAGAKKESVTKIKDNTYEIMVKEPASNNFANRRVQDLLAQIYNTSSRMVRIVSGHRSQSKIFDVVLEN